MPLSFSHLLANVSSGTFKSFKVKKCRVLFSWQTFGLTVKGIAKERPQSQRLRVWSATPWLPPVAMEKCVFYQQVGEWFLAVAR